jgi:hypothetical protein
MTLFPISQVTMSRIKFGYYLGFAFIAAAFIGCASLLGPEWDRQVGTIEIPEVPLPPPIELPDTVEQGVPFASNVVTFGSSSCIRADGAEINVSGLTVHITPYDLVAVTGDCNADLAIHPRNVTLQFEEAGKATVRVHGLTRLGEPTQYEAQLLVIPRD